MTCSVVIQVTLCKESGGGGDYTLEAGCGVWGVGCGVWRVACGVWRVACGVWRVACGVWRVACGVWLTCSVVIQVTLCKESGGGGDYTLEAGCGVWGVWRVACGVWRVACG